jgi:UMF1 family MFS transporter
MILYGFVLVVIANVCVEGGLVFYNAYLPLIALRGNVGKISAAGFAMGYLGSIVSLLAALYFLRMNMISLVWIQVALFFSLFSIPVFVYMPSDIRKSGVIASARKGFVQSFETIKLLLSGRESRFFLLAYFLYTDGVNTVIVFSSIFAVTTLGFSKYEVIALFLIVQISAFIGSFAISYPIDRWGPLRVVRMSIVVWILATVGAFFAKSKGEFYFIAILAGFVLGTVQAGSRALYTFFIPKERESEFFGVYSTVGKTSSILGPLLFGILSASFKNQRPAVLSISLLFVLGFILLTGVRKINY